MRRSSKYFLNNSENRMEHSLICAQNRSTFQRFQKIRDMPGILKFRLNDGNIRIGRGFGKRSYKMDDTKEDYEQSNEDNIKM